MNQYNWPEEEGVEAPFDEEWAPVSTTTTSPQVDNAGFPISLSPADLITPVSSFESWPYEQVTDRNVFSTPPRTKRSEKPPATPDTFVSRHDEVEIGEPDFVDFRRRDEDEIKSTSLSGRSGSDSSQKDGGWLCFKTKSAMIAAAVTLGLLLIAILATIVVFVIQKNESMVLATVSPTVSQNPSSSPSRSPTPAPSTSPSSSPSSAPSMSPTRQPSQSPTVSFEVPIRDFFQESGVTVSASNSAMSKALEWLVDEANEARSLVFPFDTKYLQRFGILTLYFSVNPNNQEGTNPGSSRLPRLSMRNQDECLWTGMRCDENGLVTNIKMSKLRLFGTLDTEWRFFPNLKSIDFSNNRLKGSIPEGLYGNLGLKDVYLYKNQLTGTISSSIGNLDLRTFHVSHNQISGSIPPELGNNGSLRTFNVYRNQMTGTIPSNMRLRQLYFMDLGRNFFSGTLPPDTLGTEPVRLRHLHFDHNNFMGTFPTEVLNAGDGRLRVLTLENNQFTGIFPGNHQLLNHKVELTIQNNNFVAMNTTTCLLDTFAGGELVEFKSDCDICRCGDTYLCQYCQP